MSACQPFAVEAPYRAPPRASRGALRRLAVVLALAVVTPACGQEEKDPKPAVDPRAPAAGPVLGTGPRHFVNRKEALTSAPPELTEHFVPFSFDVPEGWTYEQGGSIPPRDNFVKVERRADAQTTAENFSVGTFWMTVPAESTAEAEVAAKVDRFKKRIERGFPNAKILSDATMELAGRPARGFRFSVHVPAAPSGGTALDGWGLVLFVPDVVRSDGAVLVMMATSADKQFTSADDVGVKGDLPKILASFRFGP